MTKKEVKMPAQTMAHNNAKSPEPRFSLPPTTPLSSKKEMVIGGVQIYLYGLDELKDTSGVEVAVVYLAHNRTRTYKVTEGIAHEVLHRYRTDIRSKRVELIAVTMNMRNHGNREINSDANRTWRDGNENHGIDVLSIISGSAQDFKLVLDYLPAYLPQFTCFYNIMAGVSLGGHTAWRMASLASDQLSGLAIVVGCPSLSSLLLSRLGIDATALDTTSEELDGVSYEQLESVMNEQQRRRWPKPLAEIVREGDRKVSEEFPTQIPVLLCNGVDDRLVPARYTAHWVGKRRIMRNGNRNVKKNEKPPSPVTLGEGEAEQEKVTFFVQENTGHSCTKEMVAMTAAWIGGIFEV